MRGGSNTPDLSAGASAPKVIAATPSGTRPASTRNMPRRGRLNLDGDGLDAANKAFVHVVFVRAMALDRSGFDGKRHQLLELRLDETKIAVGDAIGGMVHHELQHVGILI